jgi:uncharacterized delta-60 repeat protein
VIARSSRGRRIGALAATAAAVSIAGVALAAPGDLDPKFGRDGRLELSFAGGAESANDIAVLADGTMVVAGTTTDIGEDYFPEIAVTRLQPNGRFDESFGGDGRVSFAFPESSEFQTGLGVQADGRIVLSGDAGFELARLNTNGSPDTSFSGDGFEVTDLPGVTNESAGDLALLADGRILVGGSSKVGGARKWTLARYTAAGALDTSFSGDGVETTDFPGEGEITELAVQADGRIVAGGSSGDRAALARYMPNGGLDSSFSGDGQLSSDAGSSVSGLALDGSGRIVTANEAKRAFSITRFTSGGEPDPEFSGDGLQEVRFRGERSFSNALIALPDGGAVAVGGTRHTAKSNEDDYAVAQLEANGDLDRSFSGDGRVTTDFFCDQVDEARSIARAPDGRLIVGGSCQYSFVRGQFTDGNFTLAPYLTQPGKHDADADGVLDKRDRCPEAVGPRKRRGCGVVKRAFIRVRSERGKLVGELASRAVDCELGQKVTLIRNAGGRDRVVDTVKSPRGSFKFKLEKGATYKVRTPKHLERRAGFCTQATSSPVKP